MKYSAKLQNLINRRGDNQYVQKSFSAESASRVFSETALRNKNYTDIDFPDSVKYTLGAMAEVDKDYTDNTFKEGERIKNQLSAIKNEGYNVSFRFQGSTTNNTHIKQYSDIDILVLQEKFVFTTKPISPYTGNWKLEQVTLRQMCYDLLNDAYPSATVDNSGRFSISLKGGSLKRKIDVVPACWDFNRDPSTIHEDAKGVRVYTKNCQDYNVNYPFYNNSLIDKKDHRCGGNYRKAVRLLKTLKSDSNRNIDISSYDIVALLYNMNDTEFNVGQKYLTLVRNITSHLQYLVNNQSYFKTLDVPDKTRKINAKTTLEALIAMTVEVGDLEKDLVQELSQVRKSLEESFPNYGINRRIY